MAHYCHQLQNFAIFDIGVTFLTSTSCGLEADTCTFPVSQRYQPSKFDHQPSIGGRDEAGRKGPGVDAIQ